MQNVMGDNLLDQIQNELVQTNHSFSNTLRKALVLAKRINSSPLQEWVRSELNGYASPSLVPDYRVVSSRSFVNYVTVYKQVSRVPVMIESEHFLQASILDGISGLEDIIQKARAEPNAVLQIDWPLSTFEVIASMYAKDRVQVTRGWKEVAPSELVQILDSAKNRLLDFTLELEGLTSSSGKTLGNLNQYQIDSLVNDRILKNPKFIIQGVENMSVFDQRGQNVNYQYNAAGNISFDSVNNQFDVIETLEMLQEEVSTAIESGQLDEDTATDAEYQMKKAVQQAKKPEAKKETIIEHLSSIKNLVAGAVSLAGLVKGISEAIVAVQKFFP